MIWAPIIFSAGAIFGWLVAYPRARADGYHEGAIDALDNEREYR